MLEKLFLLYQSYYKFFVYWNIDEIKYKYLMENLENVLLGS